jgi:hypothetical protein
MQHSILLWLVAFVIYLIKRPIQREPLFEVIDERKKERENNTQNGRLYLRTSQRDIESKSFDPFKAHQKLILPTWDTAFPADILHECERNARFRNDIFNINLVL